MLLNTAAGLRPAALPPALIPLRHPAALQPWLQGASLPLVSAWGRTLRPTAVACVVAVLAGALWLGAAPNAHAQEARDAPAPGVVSSGPGRLPALGDTSELSAAAERRIGESIAISIYRDTDYIDDPVLQAYLESIWQPLRVASRARGELSPELDERFAWQLFLFKDRSVNAFALPGAYFGVHLGLIGTVGSRAELASVLAHEMSHVTQRHISRLLTHQKRQTPLLIAAMIVGALAAGKSGDMASAAIVGGQALAAQGQLNFSRDMEREADRVGFSVMTDAGFDSQGAGAMFDRLQQASRLNDNGDFPYLRSHPLTTQRIAEAQSRLQLLPPNAPLQGDAARSAEDDRLLHAMMSARARALVQTGVDGRRAMVTQAQRRLSNPSTQPVARSVDAAASAPAAGAPAAQRYRVESDDAGVLYAGALAATQLREFDTAQKLVAQLTPLLVDAPRARQAGRWLASEVNVLAKRAPSSADLAAPDGASRADVLVWSRAAMAAGQASEVANRLQTWVADHPQDSTAWQTLAQAYGQQGQSVRAIRADAESRAAQLDYPAALDRLKAAQALMRSQPGSADYIEGSIIDTRTRQMELLVREQALQ